eukprot:g910.t1
MGIGFSSDKNTFSFSLLNEVVDNVHVVFKSSCSKIKDSYMLQSSGGSSNTVTSVSFSSDRSGSVLFKGINPDKLVAIINGEGNGLTSLACPVVKFVNAKDKCLLPPIGNIMVFATYGREKMYKGKTLSLVLQTLSPFAQLAKYSLANKVTLSPITDTFWVTQRTGVIERVLQDDTFTIQLANPNTDTFNKSVTQLNWEKSGKSPKQKVLDDKAFAENFLKLSKEGSTISGAGMFSTCLVIYNENKQISLATTSVEISSGKLLVSGKILCLPVGQAPPTASSKVKLALLAQYVEPNKGDCPSSPGKGSEQSQKRFNRSVHPCTYSRHQQQYPFNYGQRRRFTRRP